MIKCNLCSFEIDENDDMIKERKARHEERHDGNIYKFQNIIRGKVVWLTEADQLMNNKISMKTNWNRCLNCNGLASMYENYCSEKCKNDYKRAIEHDKRRALSIKRKEERHEMQLRTNGKIFVGRGRGNRTGRKRNYDESHKQTRVGMSKAYIELFIHARYRLALKLIQNKPMTTHDLCRSGMIMKLDGTMIQEPTYNNQSIASNLLKKLCDYNLIDRTVVQVERHIKQERYTTGLYDVWLYHLPKLDTPYDKLMYLTKTEVFKRKGLRACKHVLL